MRLMTWYKCIVCIVAVKLVNGSTKKGIAIGNGYLYHCGDEQAFTHVNWWYDWHQNEDKIHALKNCTGPYRSGFVPMVWGLKRWDGNITVNNIPSTARYILGYNEPDHTDQAHMSPEVAAQHWKNDIEPHGHGKILVSPAVTNLNWLTQFFHYCKHCRVDHIAVHKYACSASVIMNMLKDAWHRFHKPIWLTEFSCPHSTDPNQQLQFMKDLLPQLESAHYVYRYAWFVSRTLKSGWVTPAVNLLHNNSPTLTTLGHYYNNFRA